MTFLLLRLVSVRDFAGRHFIMEYIMQKQFENNPAKKIKDFKDIPDLVTDLLRANPYKIGLCHGCFDILHSGHIHLFQQAKEHCDLLFVTITGDACIIKPNKINNEVTRAKMLSAIEYVDYVAIVPSDITGVSAIQAIRPQFYFKGDDTDCETEAVKTETSIMETNGGQVIYLETRQSVSSIGLSLTDEQRETINTMRQSNIIKDIDSFSDIELMLVGETIVDDYVYVKCLDKAPKTSILAVKPGKKYERSLGATALSARILSNFCQRINLHTAYDAYIPIQTPHPTILRTDYRVSKMPIKLRYIDESLPEHIGVNVMFEVCDGDAALNTEQDQALRASLLATDKPIFVMDFGHGLISKNILTCLMYIGNWIGIVCQTNESNLGFNLAAKYWDIANYLCIDEYELRLAVCDDTADIKTVMSSFYSFMTRSNVILAVTSGADGVYLMQNDKFIKSPVMPAKVLDRIGAGDAFFALSALAAYKGLPLETIGFLGNIAGAIKVSYVGTGLTITKENYTSYIKRLLK